MISVLTSPIRKSNKPLASQTMRAALSGLAFLSLAQLWASSKRILSASLIASSNLGRDSIIVSAI